MKRQLKFFFKILINLYKKKQLNEENINIKKEIKKILKINNKKNYENKN